MISPSNALIKLCRKDITMNIERQYFRQWRSESSDSSYYILPYGDEVSKEYGRAVCKEKCMKIIREGSSEYAAQCKEIAVSDAVGTKFTHIITNVVSDGNDDSYYDSFEEAGINSERISLDHLAETREQAIKNMEEMADGEEEIGGGFNWNEKTYTLEEFKRILNSSDTLTEEQLECFHSVYCDYQGFGYFRGVAYIEETNESAESQKNEGVIPEVHDSLIIRYKDKHSEEDFNEIVKMLKDLMKRATFVTYTDIREEFEGWKYSEEDINKILNAVKENSELPLKNENSEKFLLVSKQSDFASLNAKQCSITNNTDAVPSDKVLISVEPGNYLDNVLFITHDGLYLFKNLKDVIRYYCWEEGQYTLKEKAKELNFNDEILRNYKNYSEKEVIRELSKLLERPAEPIGLEHISENSINNHLYYIVQFVKTTKLESVEAQKNEDASAQWELGTLEDIGAYQDTTPALIFKKKDIDTSWGSGDEDFCIMALHRSKEEPEEPAFLSTYYDGYGDGYSAATVEAVIQQYNNQTNDKCLEKYGELPYPPKELCEKIGLGEYFN